MISRRHAVKIAAASLIAPVAGPTCAPGVLARRQDTSDTGAPLGPTLDKPIIVKWRIETGHVDYSIPTIADGTVYVGGDDRTLYALDAETGQERWRLSIEQRVVSTPVVADGILYVSIGLESYHDTGHLYAIDATTGQERWHAVFDDGEIDLDPVVADGVVYAGTWRGFYAIDAASGEERWQFGAGDLSFLNTFPLVTDGGVYLGSSDGGFYALDANSGEERWRFETGNYDNSISSFPLVADSVVYVANPSDYHYDLNSSLYAIDSNTGQERWHFSTENRGAISLATAQGVIYVGHLGDLYALDATSGQERWRSSLEDRSWDGITSVVLADGVLWVTIGYDLYAIDARSGQEHWHFGAAHLMSLAPMIADGIVYVGESFNAGSSGLHFYALDAKTGKELWRLDVSSGIESSAVAADGLAYITSGDPDDYYQRVLYAIGNLPALTLAKDAVIRGAPSPSGVERGTGKAGDTIASDESREERNGETWVDVTINGVNGWIPLDAIDPATLPPEGEIEYVYQP